MVEKDCPIENTLKLINGKWKSVIIYQISEYEPCRFSELQKLIPDCSTTKMTAAWRKQMERLIRSMNFLMIRWWILQTTIWTFSLTEYSLTEVGKSLVPIIRSINQWGKKYTKK